MFPAIFLDRDGVIIENRPNYVLSWGDVTVFPQALDALVKLRTSPYKIVIVTNQSAVGRGLLAQDHAAQINHQLVQELQNRGGRVDSVFMCPHAPQDLCDCRKPLPGLLLQAAEALDIDLAHSWMIGDALSDLEAGKAAGVNELALVLTGRGYHQSLLPQAKWLRPFRQYDCLADSVPDILSKARSLPPTGSLD